MIQTKSWFNFKGVYSYEYDILVERQPDIIKPKKRVDVQMVPGRSGNIHTDNNSYESYTKTVDCAILDIKKLDSITAWLDGPGDLIFSNEREKIYKAFVMDQIPFQKIGAFFNFKKFPVVFEVNPIKRHVGASNDDRIITKNNYVFYGGGTISARPVMTIYGGGNITLHINGTVIGLSNVAEYITINSNIMDAYKNAENQNYKMAGDFPLLLPEGKENKISWSGNVTKIELSPCWAWI